MGTGSCLRRVVLGKKARLLMTGHKRNATVRPMDSTSNDLTQEGCHGGAWLHG